MKIICSFRQLKFYWTKHLLFILNTLGNVSLIPAWILSLVRNPDDLMVWVGWSACFMFRQHFKAIHSTAKCLYRDRLKPHTVSIRVICFGLMHRISYKHQDFGSKIPLESKGIEMQRFWPTLLKKKINLRILQEIQPVLAKGVGFGSYKLGILCSIKEGPTDKMRLGGPGDLVLILISDLLFNLYQVIPDFCVSVFPAVKDPLLHKILEETELTCSPYYCRYQNISNWKIALICSDFFFPYGFLV